SRKELRLAVIFSTAIGLSSAIAEDWPEFRGPTGQGLSVERGLPFEWSSEKNVAWKISIPGLAWSSPVVSKGQIYLTSAVAYTATEGPSLRALCLEAKSGTLLWKVEISPSDHT